MSNIFLNKKLYKSSKFSKNILDISNKDKIYYKYNDVFSFTKEKENLPSQKEWYNSIYSYNKKFLKNISPYDKILYELIKSFFNLHVKYKEKKYFKNRRIRLTRLSINRILLSKVEILHTNKKAFFNLYIYNGEKRYLVNKLSKLTKKSKKSSLKSKILYLKSLKSKILNLKSLKSKILNLKSKIERANLIAKRNLKVTDISKKEKKQKPNTKDPYYKLRNLRNTLNKDFIKETKEFLIKEIKKLKRKEKNKRKKEKWSKYYKYLLIINKHKFENTYIYPLYKLISKFYDKKIEFNIINLKYIHLNSSILSQFLAIKIKNRKNRFLKVLYKFLINLKLPIIDNKFKYLYEKKNYILSNISTGLTNVNYKKLCAFFSYKKKSLNIIENYKHDILNQLIEKKVLTKNENRKHLINRVLKTIKHKWVYGVRLDVSGRLTRRFVAARAVSTQKYKGSLKNVDSSYKGLSSVILRGHLKSNIQYSKLSCTRRIGSFGVKGWINSL